jgi:hypothetical protein
MWGFGLQKPIVPHLKGSRPTSVRFLLLGFLQLEFDGRLVRGKRSSDVRFEVLVGLSIKNAVFLDVTPCSSGRWITAFHQEP